MHARTLLANLQTYMDGKSGAEELVRRLLADPQLMHELARHAPPPVLPAQPGA